MEYASNGKGNLGVTLGAIGTGLSVLSGGLGLMTGNNGWNNGYNNCGWNNGFNAYNPWMLNPNYVSKEEMHMMQSLASKDSEIALLKAEQDSEVKMTEVYKQSHAELVHLRDTTNETIKELQKEIECNRRQQDAWNCEQSVNNARMSGAIAANRESISDLQRVVGQITQVKVPNYAVCPGWGDITITPAAPTVTTTAPAATA